MGSLSRIGPLDRRTRVRAGALALCLLALGTAPPSRAANEDVLIQTETRPGTDPSLPAREGRIWLAGDRLRMEVASGEGPGEQARVIFRADQKLYWLLDPEHESYVQIDEDQIAKLGVRLRRTRQEMEKRLEAVPPEQRAAMKEMLAAMIGPDPGTRPKEEVRRTNRIETVLGRKARVHEILLGEEVVGEAWVVPWKDIEIDRSRFHVFRELAAFQRNMLGTLGTYGGFSPGAEPFEVFDLLGGYPLVLRRLENGKVAVETRFTKLEDTPHDAARYEVPEGYSREAGPGDRH